MINNKYSSTLIKRFFLEIYQTLRNVDRNMTEVWQEISEITSLKGFDNNYGLIEFLSYFNFINIEDGNYLKNHYISIDKIKFICESMKYIDFIDLKNLSGLVDYSGFEALVKEILLRNGFSALLNYRFTDKSTFKSKTKQNRYEIDVIGIQDKYILIIDAKQWKNRDSYSAINKAANLQYRRVLALKKNPEIFSNLIQQLVGLNHKKKLPLVLIPMMLTLEDNGTKMNENQIPLVSIYHFNAFINELYFNIKSFKTIKINRINVQTQLF